MEMNITKIDRKTDRWRCEKDDETWAKSCDRTKGADDRHLPWNPSAPLHTHDVSAVQYNGVCLL